MTTGDLYSKKHSDVGVTYKGNTDWLDVSMRYRRVFWTVSDNDDILKIGTKASSANPGSAEVKVLVIITNEVII